MKLLLVLFLITASAHASDESNGNKYEKYQEPPTELVPMPTDLVGAPTHVPESPRELSMKIEEGKGVTISVEGAVVLYVKDRITHIRIQNKEDKGCTIV